MSSSSSSSAPADQGKRYPLAKETELRIEVGDGAAAWVKVRSASSRALDYFSARAHPELTRPHCTMRTPRLLEHLR
jgi:hypothetical protein